MIRVNSIKPSHCPTVLRDWLWAEVVRMGWKPDQGYAYNRDVNLPGLMRDLCKEAATRPEFARLVDVCLEMSKREEIYWQKSANRYPFKPRTGPTKEQQKMRAIAGYIYERTDTDGKIVGYTARIQLKKSLRRHSAYISRSFQSPAEAFSFRDRVEIALTSGGDPYSVPMFESAFD